MSKPNFEKTQINIVPVYVRADGRTALGQEPDTETKVDVSVERKWGRGDKALGIEIAIQIKYAGFEIESSVRCEADHDEDLAPEHLLALAKEILAPKAMTAVQIQANDLASRLGAPRIGFPVSMDKQFEDVTLEEVLGTDS